MMMVASAQDCARLARVLVNRLHSCDKFSSLSRDYQDALTAVETFRSLQEVNLRRAEEYAELAVLLEKELQQVVVEKIADQSV